MRIALVTEEFAPCGAPEAHLTAEVVGRLTDAGHDVVLDADITDVEKNILAAARQLAKDPKWRSRIIEQPEVWGLESVTGDALVTRLVMKTRANAKDDVARELRMRLKNAIDGMGLKLPQLNSITLTGLEGAQRVRGANPPKTKPNPVPPAAERPVWKPKKSGRTDPHVPPPDEGTPT